MALSDLVDDLVSSKKWASTFRSAAKKQDKPDGKFLSSLLKDYQECKRKETNSLILKKMQKLKQPIKISGTMCNSQITYFMAKPPKISNLVLMQPKT